MSDEDDAFVHGLVMRVRAEFAGAEPSDLVSARIMAAARARPRAKKWWQHPGIAAAAMLVIVAGAVLWGKKGGEVAEPRRPAESQTTVVHPAPAPEAAPVAPPAVVQEPAKDVAPPPPPQTPAPVHHAEHTVEEKKPAADRTVGTASTGGEEIDDATPHVVTAPAIDGAEANDQAAQLTRQARSAAKSGQCDAVKMLAGKVQKLDKSYYNDAFANDPDIRRCR